MSERIELWKRSGEDALYLDPDGDTEAPLLVTIMEYPDGGADAAHFVLTDIAWSAIRTKVDDYFRSLEQEASE